MKTQSTSSKKKPSSVNRVALLGPEDYNNVAHVTQVCDYMLQNLEKVVIVPRFRQAEVYGYFRDYKIEKHCVKSKWTHAIVFGSTTVDLTGIKVREVDIIY